MKPIIEAHRGASNVAPENTLAAFQRAIDLRADSIELDVHPAADGTLVVIHDATVDRTTNGIGAVSSLTCFDLRKLDAGLKFHADFAGERIPTLGEVMGRLVGTSTNLNIEIKQPPPGLSLADAIVNLIGHYGKIDHYVVSSFDLTALLAIRSLEPRLTLAPIGKAPEILALAQTHHFPWIHCNRTTLTDDLIRRAHADGIRVAVWTVDDPLEARQWAEQGIDKIITNCPREMLALDWSSRTTSTRI